MMIVRTSLSSTGAKNTISQQHRDDVTVGRRPRGQGEGGAGTKPGILKEHQFKAQIKRFLFILGGVGVVADS